MERKYLNTENKTSDVVFFTGKEVENTFQKGERTLFVVGLQTVNSILNALEKTNIKHIYFGANHSYINNDFSEHWLNMVSNFLKLGYWCTLDIDSSLLTVAFTKNLNLLCKYKTFIPIISVKIPEILNFNKHATIKIDDIGFNQTNPGVWCHNLFDLQTDETFTSWNEYVKDEKL